MLIKDNIARIEERIQRACERSGRKREEVRLMAVSKFESMDAIKDAYRAGIRLFGESRVQEAKAKFSTIPDDIKDIELHCIGSLQRNKVKGAIQLFSCIQSVDRDELLAELALQCKKADMTMEVLLELHTGEDSKTGYPDFESLARAAEQAMAYPQITLKGLMTMAPFTHDVSQIRESFRTLAEAQRFLQQRFPELSLEILSMGMSNDFEIAIEEGSTLLRIGTALFKGDGQ
ncbi:MAG: YggS family pyridoxal phosphate-dependent enzyme [Treponema sp.]|nr:YggS family pyridoxal phosphate-dependent enzyme [Treponema sp.]